MKIDDAVTKLRKRGLTKLLIHIFKNAGPDEVFESAELRKMTGANHDAVKNACACLVENGEVAAVRLTNYAVYGKPKAIEKVKKKVEWSDED